MPERQAPSQAPTEPNVAVAQSTPRKAAEGAEAFAIEAARLMHDDKTTDVVVLDVRGLSQVYDYIVIGSGTSDRQMRSVLDHVQELGAARDMRAFKTHADDRATWLLADFVHVVVHLFEPNARAHYDLEMLWGDAPRIAWERPDQLRRDMAGLSPQRR